MEQDHDIESAGLVKSDLQISQHDRANPTKTIWFVPSFFQHIFVFPHALCADQAALHEPIPPRRRSSLPIRSARI